MPRGNAAVRSGTPSREPSQRQLGGEAVSSSFIRRVAQLASGSVVAQALQLVALPVLSRLYGPRPYGVYGTFAGALLLVGAAITFRYDLAIQLPRSDRMANDVARGCIWLSGLASPLVLLLAMGLAAVLPGVGQVSGFAACLAVSAFLLGVFNTMSAVAIRGHRFRAVSVARVTQVAVSVALSVLLALGRRFEQGLLLGNIAGYAAGSLALLLQGTTVLGLRSPRGARRSFVALRQYRSFAVFNLPQAVMDGLRPLGVVAAIQHFFGPAATGLYHVANQALVTPSATVSQAVAQVYYRELAAKGGRERGRAMSLRLVAGLGTAAIVAGVTVLLAGDEVVVRILGPRWTGAHAVLTSLLPMVAVNFVVAPLVFAFHAVRRHREFLVWGAAYNIAAVGTLILAGALGAPLRTALLAYSITAAILLGGVGLRSVAVISER